MAQLLARELAPAAFREVVERTVPDEIDDNDCEQDADDDRQPDRRPPRRTAEDGQVLRTARIKGEADESGEDVGRGLFEVGGADAGDVDCVAQSEIGRQDVAKGRRVNGYLPAVNGQGQATGTADAFRRAFDRSRQANDLPDDVPTRRRRDCAGRCVWLVRAGRRGGRLPGSGS